MDSARPQTGAGIVVVDGSAFFREAVCEILVAAGHRCTGAASLDEAAPALADAEVGLWVLDLATTGSAGIEAWRAVRQRRPAVRTIVLSDPDQQERVLEALRAGASDYLAKPLHEEELRLSAARALAAWQAETELERLRAQAAEAPDSAVGAAEDEAVESDLALARDLCLAVAQHGDPDRVLDVLLSVLAERLAADGVALYLRDPEGRAFLRERQWEGARADDRAWLAADRGLTGASVETGVFVAAARPAADPRFDPSVDAREGEPSGAPLLCLPLRFRDHTIGLVRAFLPPGREPSLRTAEIAAAALSAALRSVLLYRSWRSGIDELARARREVAARPVPGPSSDRAGWITRNADPE